jgi:hypothetical protein
MELPRTRDGVGPPHRCPPRPRQCPLRLKKNAVRSCRPTGRLDPNPAALASAHLALAALEYRARQGESILLYEEETLLWRFALPRSGWWRRAQRSRLPTRPLSPSQIKREEARKRQAWQQYHAWSRITSGVFLPVIGAVQYGTSRVFYKIVPPFDPHACRQSIQQVMGSFDHTGTAAESPPARSGDLWLTLQ